MTTTAIRERLHHYIDEADDKHLEKLYLWIAGEMADETKWWEDEEFVAELDERVNRYETGLDKACTWAELEAEIAERKKLFRGKRIPGALKGKVSLPDDFNEPIEDLKDYM